MHIYIYIHTVIYTFVSKLDTLICFRATACAAVAILDPSIV